MSEVNIENVVVEDKLLNLLDSVAGPKKDRQQRVDEGEKQPNINEIKFFIQNITDLQNLQDLNNFVSENITRLRLVEERKRAEQDEFYKNLKF